MITTAMAQSGWITCRSALTLLWWPLLLVGSFPCQFDGNYDVTKVVCYISAANENFDYDSLRMGWCSHIILVDLFGIGKDGSLQLQQTSSRPLFLLGEVKKRFAAAGDQARFVVSIGGVAQKSAHMSRAIRDADGRGLVVDTLISFLTKTGLDGIDLAWLYPAQFGGIQADRQNFVLLLQELQLRAKACQVTVSLTLGVDPKDIVISYDVPKINELVDFVNLLTGDYHDPEKPTHIAPLYGFDKHDKMNIQYSVNSYINAGINPRKIVVLTSSYAYMYVQRLPKDYGEAAKLKSVMRLSFLSAREIISRENFHTSWDDSRLVPYGMVAKNSYKKWITYNDEESIRRKAEFVLQRRLGGIGLFTVDQDDFKGRAGYGTYPILRAMAKVVYPDAVSSCEAADEPVPTIVCPTRYNATETVTPVHRFTVSQHRDGGEDSSWQQYEFTDDVNACYRPTTVSSCPVTVSVPVTSASTTTCPSTSSATTTSASTSTSTSLSTSTTTDSSTSLCSSTTECPYTASSSSTTESTTPMTTTSTTTPPSTTTNTPTTTASSSTTSTFSTSTTSASSTTSTTLSSSSTSSSSSSSTMSTTTIATTTEEEY